MLPSIIAMLDEEGDRDFMTQLFMNYRRLMCSEIGKILSNANETEDVLQNSLIRLCDKVALLRSLDERKRISYVITTVRNQAKNHLRNSHKVPLLSFDDDQMNLAENVSDGTDIEDTVILKEQLKDLASVWDRLDDTSQLLLEGKYILKLSDIELGKHLGLNPSSIRMMLSRARKKALRLMTEK
ncbi:MAG: sigma-70 family RNA polymerase sigma factor [Bacillota bacterium]